MSALDYARSIHRALARERRKMAAKSPATFARVYLASHCSCPFSLMHVDLFDGLSSLIERRSGRLAIAAPRGHAKSTIVSLAFILWCLLYEKEKLILLVSATREQAVMLLGHIKEQLEKNDLLRSDFPELCRADGGPGSGRQPKPWRDNRILLANRCMVCAYGAGQSLRGARNGTERPGLIVADDIEDAEQVISEDQRLKLAEWFKSTLLHAGHTETNVVMIGTVLHHDSLLANLTSPTTSHGWRGRRYRAVMSFSDRPELWERWSVIFRGDDQHGGRSGPDAADAFYRENEKDLLSGTKVLWPEWENYRDLMIMREREGRGSFQAEKQNEPLDPEQCIFAEEALHYWDDEYPDVQALIDAHGKDGRFFGACDPSLGQRTGRGDYTAIVILYQARKTKINYVIAADIARRSPDQTIDRILHYASMYSFSSFGVEGNHFQQLMIDNLQRRAEERSVRLRIEKIESRSNKDSRIANIEPDVSQGRIWFSRRHHLLLDQLRAFPLASHDDGPDALEMAVATAQKPRNRTIIREAFTGHVHWDSNWAQ